MSDKELQKQFDYHQLNNVMLHDKLSDADREELAMNISHCFPTKFWETF